MKDFKKHQLEENWNQYCFNCMEGEEPTFAEYICVESENDPSFFRWLFDDDSLSDFECKDENEWRQYVVSELDIEKDLTDEIEVARYNVPYDCAEGCVDYSLRYYDFHGICVFLSTKNDEVYLGNIDEIGEELDDDNNGWWNIDEEKLSKLKKQNER